MHRLWRWVRDHSGVRVRTALTAALVVALALVVAGVAMVLLLERALLSVERSATFEVNGSSADPDDPLTVAALGVARDLMLAGAPLLVAVAGLATFAAAGRALRPVETMRARRAHQRRPRPASSGADGARRGGPARGDHAAGAHRRAQRPTGPRRRGRSR